MIKFTLADRRQIARRHTLNATQVKDWRLRRKSDRQLKALAIELTAGKGYIIASAKELHNRYPSLMPDSNDTGRLWDAG